MTRFESACASFLGTGFIWLVSATGDVVPVTIDQYERMSTALLNSYHRRLDMASAFALSDKIKGRN